MTNTKWRRRRGDEKKRLCRNGLRAWLDAAWRSAEVYRSEEKPIGRSLAMAANGHATMILARPDELPAMLQAWRGEIEKAKLADLVPKWRASTEPKRL